MSILITQKSSSGGLVNLTESYTFGTQSTVSLKPKTSDVNSNIAIIPKGNGAIIASQPDGTSVGGNARGAYAVDLQMVRSAATQVASGNYSFNVGLNSTASSAYAVAMGYGVTVSGTASFAAGQTLSLSNSFTFALGVSNIVSGVYAGALGVSLSSTGQASLAVGQENSASGNWALATGYRTHSTNNQSSSFGFASRAYMSCGISYSSNGGSAGAGTFQGHLVHTGDSINSVGPSINTELIAGFPRVTFNSQNRVHAILVIAHAICTAVGSSGTLTVGDTFYQIYTVLVQRLSGIVTVIDVDTLFATPKGAAAMNDAAFVFTATAGNNGLQVDFTSPSSSNGSSFKANCNFYIGDILQ